MENVIHLNSVGSALVPSTLKVYPVEANGHVVFDPCLATPSKALKRSGLLLSTITTGR